MKGGKDKGQITTPFIKKKTVNVIFTFICIHCHIKDSKLRKDILFSLKEKQLSNKRHGSKYSSQQIVMLLSSSPASPTSPSSHTTSEQRLLARAKVTDATGMQWVKVLNKKKKVTWEKKSYEREIKLSFGKYSEISYCDKTIHNTLYFLILSHLVISSSWTGSS